MGVINVLDLFITNDSLIIKTQVIRGISDHDAVFFEGININKQYSTNKNARWLSCTEKQTTMP